MTFAIYMTSRKYYETLLAKKIYPVVQINWQITGNANNSNDDQT